MEIASLFVAFAGGIFGAAVGALGAFVILGFLIIIGVAAQSTGADLLSIPLGAAFGPHVGGFAAGVAAAAYAAHKGKLETGKDIVTSLMGLNRPDVLLVGGLFGIGGYLVNFCLNQVNIAWTDNVALTVVISAMVARLLWGNGLLGKVDNGTRRYAPPQDATWVPWQSSFPQRFMIGVGAGTLSAYIALLLGAENGGAVLGFAISAISLIPLGFGFQVPITHHITLVAAVVALASGSLLWGSLFGVAAALVGEFFANTFQAHGNTHIDPPATTIATLTSVSILFANLGFYGLPMPF